MLENILMWSVVIASLLTAVMGILVSIKSRKIERVRNLAKHKNQLEELQLKWDWHNNDVIITDAKRKDLDELKSLIDIYAHNVNKLEELLKEKYGESFAMGYEASLSINTSPTGTTP